MNSRGAMLLKAGRLFDGRTPKVFHDWVVEVEDGRILDMGSRSRAASGRGADDVVDLGDVTLLPGLIDAHQHLVFDASDDPVANLQAEDDAAVLQRMQGAAERALAVGITTIRDLGDRNYLSVTLRDRFRDGQEVGPRILVAGPPITVSGGHCWFLGGVADGEDGIRRAVRERVSHGVDVIKIMATGGNMTPTFGPHQSQYNRAELAAAVDEAHAHRLRIAVHAHGPHGIADALATKVDSIEHCTFFTADGVDADPDILEQLALSGIAISMTSALLPGSGPRFPAMQQRLDAILANFATLVRAGARVVCSSDAGVGPNKPHDVLPHGVVGLPRIGMTNAQALTAVTAVAAEVCGIADTIGTLEPGKEADFLAVRGNPLEDINAIHDVAAVFVRGTRVRMPK
jgi:imidazolonepropionase-like amidohydrolase